MLLTETELGERVGLPGPVIAQLLQPGFVNDKVIGAATPQFCEVDLVRAQVAARMLAFGVRWEWVQASVVAMPITPEELRISLDFWSAISPPPPKPPRHYRDSDVLVIAVVVTIVGQLIVAAGMAFGYWVL